MSSMYIDIDSPYFSIDDWLLKNEKFLHLQFDLAKEFVLADGNPDYELELAILATRKIVDTSAANYENFISNIYVWYLLEQLIQKKLIRKTQDGKYDTIAITNTSDPSDQFRRHSGNARE